MPCQPVICTEVTIIDDDTVELLEKTFTVRLERTPGLDYRISLEDTPATITITDDDGTGDDYITMTVEQCAIQKCVLVPVNISAINQLSINLEPPANHDNRIELIDVKHNMTILSTFVPTVEFERRSLTVQEEDGRAEVCVLVTAHGHHSELPIPLTLSTSDVTAVAGQDYRSLQSILKLDPSEEKACFDVAIINDVRVEDMEQFTLSLVYDFGSGGDVIVKEDKVDIWINDTDEALVQLEREHYSLTEGADCEICAISLVAVETEICIRFKILGIKVKICITFPQPSCGIFRVEENNILENPSTRPITLESDDSRISIIGNGSITIRDNPSFVPGEDYEPLNEKLYFAPCQTRSCINISTIEDGCVVELVKNFTVMLRRDAFDGIKIEPSAASVGIHDSDVAYVRIMGGRRDVPVNEGDGYARLFLAVTDEFGSITCRVLFDFTVAVYTEAGTATINKDYEHISRNIQFSRDLVESVRIRIIDDDIVDCYREETFNVILQNTPGMAQRIKPVRTPVTVVIRDNDVATFGLEGASCKVDEAVTLRVCVVLRDVKRDCPVEFPFDLRLEARAATTTSGDHDANVTDITIGECSRSQCTNITVYDDSSLELDETFYISLLKLPNHDGRILLDVVEKRVTIEDNDNISIIFNDPAIAVEGFPIQVCLLVEGSPRSECPSLVEIQVQLRTEDGTATYRGDYVRQTRRLTIPVCAKNFCYNISTIDNNLLVENHEYFYVTLTHGSNGDLNERINIPTPTQRYEIFDNDNAADYDKSRVDVTFRPCDARECVAVPIIDDCSLERDENFTISLEPEVFLTDRIIINDSLTVTIEDNDNTFIEMEHAEYKVFENASQIEVCAVIRPAGCKPSIDFPVRIYTRSDSAEATGLSADYVSTETNLIFSSSVNKAVCMPINIIENIEVEHLEESFHVTLQLVENTPDGVNLTRNEAEVIIVDDDVAELGFVMLAYTVREEDNGEVEICVEVKGPDTNECPVVYPLEFIVTVTDITATEGEDYVDPVYDEDNPFRYDACARENCFTIEIKNDNEVEDTIEQFDVTLEFSGGEVTAVTFQQDTATVAIIDEDVAMVSFTEEFYIVDEGVDSGKVRVCVMVVPPVDFDFSVNFTTTEEGSAAVVNEDYTATNATLQFRADSEEQCIDVPILDDYVLEELEFFKLELKISITLSLKTGEKQEATVGLENTTYTVMENELKLNVCVVVNAPLVGCPIFIPFELLFVATPATAFQGSDYRVQGPTLRFGSCAKRQCLTVDIIDNNLIEDTETFTLTLQHPLRGGTDDIILGPTVATVTIEDEDMTIVTFDRTEYSVQETSGSLTICARVVSPAVSCPVTTPFSLTLYVYDGTASNNSDYVAYRIQTIEFSHCRRSACAPRNITFVNDRNDVEVEEVESFDLFLTSNFPLVRPDPYTAEVIIHDDSERAYIRLEQRAFTVIEGVDATVRICAEVYDPTPDRSSCPVVFDFEIYLSVDGEDFPMAFRRCSFNACVSVPIDDDEQLELTKRYTYRLERTDDLDRRIIVNTASGTLTVIDDPTDEAVLKLDKTAYSVQEENRTVTVCVEVDSPVIDTPIDFSFSVLLNTIDGTAVSITRGNVRADFSAQRRSFYFSVRETRECYNIPVTNDDTQEDKETFTVTVNRTSSLDPRIRLEDNVAVVSIIDADIATVEFESTAYSVERMLGKC
ncbi:FRAS1-related extracellular matrix protein 2 [Geodia barretti]|uniref:FRAS1-related extracellular matrix protein 2 n=1 Tax=Geodia barretti TaxID=519541 RepID=A0AA35RMG6_GEOBA|nr:FRAS1-related extracellular matrix protein 2 [Geodia barretti]